MKLKIGPGALVAAAFIGPGTVTTCVLAGQEFGTSLLWVLIFAIGATIVLQEMAARLGVGARRGLGEAIREGVTGKVSRAAAFALVGAAILIGNAAYQGGNLAGAALGMEALGFDARRIGIAAMAIVAGALLLLGAYRHIERVLIGIVILMSLAFLLALGIVRPGIGDIAAGLVPRMPEGSLLILMALIGTTIVPYNLFLHASAAKRRWQGETAVKDARADTVLAILLGGVVSASILLVASVGGGEGGASGLVVALEPAFGAGSRFLIGAGLLAAGLSSAITAPMAAGYVAAELTGREALFRPAALSVLAFGTGVAMLGARPEAIIVLAQAANGVLLPLVAGFLLVLMNRKAILGAYTNGAVPNALGGAVFLLTLFLGLRGVARALGVWP
ncbi:Nramp family divalent metal transporter [Parvularcula mediterranea]|nr:Nramp family divalent metal transporter [Parvularcula mediterranea]